MARGGCEVEELLRYLAVYGQHLLVTFLLQDGMSDRARRWKATGFLKEKLPLVKNKEFCSIQAAPVHVPLPGVCLSCQCVLKHNSPSLSCR